MCGLAGWNGLPRVCLSPGCEFLICDHSSWYGEGLQFHRRTVGHTFCIGLSTPGSCFASECRSCFVCCTCAVTLESFFCPYHVACLAPGAVAGVVFVWVGWSLLVWPVQIGRLLGCMSLTSSRLIPHLVLHLILYLVLLPILFHTVMLLLLLPLTTTLLFVPTDWNPLKNEWLTLDVLYMYFVKRGRKLIINSCFYYLYYNYSTAWYP